MIFWYKIYKFEKTWADVFQIYPNATHFNRSQFCPSLSLLSFPVFCLSSSIVMSRYFVISVNSMTTWSMLKLPKIAWPSPFKLSKKTLRGSGQAGRMLLERVSFLAKPCSGRPCSERMAQFGHKHVALKEIIIWASLVICLPFNVKS